MKYIKTILQMLMPKKLPIPLGRWKIETCKNQTNHKVDLSNEDHCGTCNQYKIKIPR